MTDPVKPPTPPSDTGPLPTDEEAIRAAVAALAARLVPDAPSPQPATRTSSVTLAAATAAPATVVRSRASAPPPAESPTIVAATPRTRLEPKPFPPASLPPSRRGSGRLVSAALLILLLLVAGGVWLMRDHPRVAALLDGLRPSAGEPRQATAPQAPADRPTAARPVGPSPAPSTSPPPAEPKPVTAPPSQPTPPTEAKAVTPPAAEPTPPTEAKPAAPPPAEPAPSTESRPATPPPAEPTPPVEAKPTTPPAAPSAPPAPGEAKPITPPAAPSAPPAPAEAKPITPPASLAPIEAKPVGPPPAPPTEAKPTIPPAAPPVSPTAPAPAVASPPKIADVPAAPAPPSVAAAPATPDVASAPPTFDNVLVRDGRAVIAGRAPPGSRVEVQVDGRTVTTVEADGRGEWVAILDTPLAPGGHDIRLVQTLPGGTPVPSDRTVAVLIPPPALPSPPTASPPAAPAASPATPPTDAPQPDKPVQAPAPPAAPLVVATPTAPGGASQVLQGPPLARAGDLVVGTVDYDELGRMTITGRANPGQTVRVYLNNQPLGDTVADPDGTWTLAPGRPTPHGPQRLRADRLTAGGPGVSYRLEVPFERVKVKPGDAVTIVRGDNLWNIARGALGGGERYTAIYEANRSLIRDPNLIYPGQVFVIPKPR